MSRGFIDIEISFPDPTTGRGRVVNAISLTVTDLYGRTVAVYTEQDFELVSTVLMGAVYVHRDFEVSPSRAPGAHVNLTYSGTIGTVTVGPYTKQEPFPPALGDSVSGVLLRWVPDALPEPTNNYGDALFYEIRRYDERYPYAIKTQHIPGTSTVGFWSFDEDFDDGSASPADFIVNGIVGFTTGQISQAAEFGGQGQLQAVNPTKLSFGANQDFSLSCWVVATGHTGTGLVAGKLNDPSGTGYGLYLERDLVGGILPVFYIGAPGQALYLQADRALQTGWNHLVLVVDRDGDAVLYLNGEEVFRTDVTSFQNADFSAYDFLVGSDNAAMPNALYGMVDELIVFNQALSYIDVRQLYTEEFGVGPEKVLGYTTLNEFVDTDVSDLTELQHYTWRIYKAIHAGALEDFGYQTVKSLRPHEVEYIDSAMCLVTGRVRLPNDAYAATTWAKFYVDPRDAGLVINERIMSRDEVVAPLNRFGQFGAHLIQDTVVVCHIPAAHIKWRFAVPKSAAAKLQDIAVQKLKFMNNL